MENKSKKILKWPGNKSNNLHFWEDSGFFDSEAFQTLKTSKELFDGQTCSLEDSC